MRNAWLFTSWLVTAPAGCLHAYLHAYVVCCSTLLTTVCSRVCGWLPASSCSFSLTSSTSGLKVNQRYVLLDLVDKRPQCQLKVRFNEYDGTCLNHRSSMRFLDYDHKSYFSELNVILMQLDLHVCTLLISLCKSNVSLR